ncbi:protein WHAT'S THIS FACTOR 9, mitochondrial [Salvia hispanica]|uniref:protein WHAT'S THIS FACTOR 9, mitochondrial n=1 Tax=Salvia hispanica TaxID=49212 RepID=UPI002009319D|nr:protein WHAT'S THIS FACTOR 9, mitochondrial [Salvia hispanica]XP_047964013.1 protein WHAT'S THIS FACTOR 9, mitochondrial [Salvia hispanica]XP_047964014.1 protein WHAT'S THIS FACTOR 9, mitochondrial [Salvia hispanica]
MNFLSGASSFHLRRYRRRHILQLRTLYDGVSALKWPRDRGLDHAVERDKLLKPLLNLKNLIISEPSKSIPLTLITKSKEALGIPFRPIEFIRKYPSIFEEFQPGSLNIQPHIKLTPNVISLSSEETLLHQSVDYKQDAASRLFKLLMVSRINKIPIFVLERLKWELGLPLDYEKALIPEFPDYFRVIGGDGDGDLGENEKVLELVCWCDEFAVSELEKKRGKSGKIEFLLQFSKEFEMDKKYKKWLDEWQKLPYVSPYQNSMHLGSKTDESDKWVVAVLHEVLNLFVGKKAEKESLLYLGEYMGLRPSFKRAFLEHPGIFYVSSKIGTHTVVLREAYKRGMLIERHPLMGMRSKYIQLMNVVKDDDKAKNAQKKSGADVKKSEVGDAEGVGEDGDVTYDESDDDDDVGNAGKRGRQEVEGRVSERRNTRDAVRTAGSDDEEIVLESSTRSSRRRNARGGEMRDSSSDDESDECEEGDVVVTRVSHERKGRDFERRDAGSGGRRYNGRGSEENVSRRSTRRTNGRDGDDNERNGTNRGRHEMNCRDFERRNTRGEGRRTNGRGAEENMSKFSTRSFRRTDSRDDDSNTRRRFTRKSNFSENRTRSETGRRST